LQGVAISNSSSASLGSGANKVLSAKSLSIDSSAKLDISDNKVIVDYSGSSPMGSPSTAGSIAGLIASAYTSGTWGGNGLTTTLGTTQTYALGYAEASSLFSSFPATFAGESVDNTSVLVRYTRYGDANLDGTVNQTDFNRLASNYGYSGRLWYDGDFNYDGSVGIADYNLLAYNFGLSAGPEGPSAADWEALAAAVPEPSSAFLIITLPAILRRRRR
jgi:hypothetical protein